MTISYIEFYKRNKDNHYDSAHEFIIEFMGWVNRGDYKKAELEELAKWWGKNVCAFKNS